MKFVISSNTLLKHLSTINGIIASNPAIPIIENLLFKLDSSISIQTEYRVLKNIISDDDIIDNIMNDSIIHEPIEIAKYDTYNLQSWINLANKKFNIKMDFIDACALTIYKDNNNLKFIHHNDFEKLVNKLFIFLGYEVEPTKATRDGGYDALIMKNGFIPVHQLLECKSFQKEKKVNIGQLRSFIQVVEENRVHGGVIVTNTDFTKDVVEKVKTLYKKIKLVNGLEVLNLIKNYCEGFLLKYISPNSIEFN